jgi:hypothetical protein
MANNWGGRRKGAGPPRTTAKLRKGKSYIMERETIGGTIQKPQLWRVLSIGGDDGSVVEFQCGDDIIVFRPPDD